ncbi:MAG TPA: GNAT family protein [Phycisphaerae bacterium]|nr:GNAT family protein [Phycisphaerae bacterium]
MTTALRVHSLVEVPPPEPAPPAPARVLTIPEVMALAIDIWSAVRGIMGDDLAKPEMFFESVANKQTVVIEFGDHAGYIWVYQLVPGDSAAIGFAFSGDWRGFTKTHGDARAAQRTVIGWIMDSFELHKIRAFIARNNGKAYRMAERLGFVREGCLRREYQKGGRRIDLYAYGLLREEI